MPIVQSSDSRAHNAIRAYGTGPAGTLRQFTLSPLRHSILKFFFFYSLYARVYVVVYRAPRAQVCLSDREHRRPRDYYTLIFIAPVARNYCHRRAPLCANQCYTEIQHHRICATRAIRFLRSADTRVRTCTPRGAYVMIICNNNV